MCSRVRFLEEPNNNPAMNLYSISTFQVRNKKSNIIDRLTPKIRPRAINKLNYRKANPYNKNTQLHHVLSWEYIKKLAQIKKQYHPTH